MACTCRLENTIAATNTMAGIVFVPSEVTMLLVETPITTLFRNGLASERGHQFPGLVFLVGRAADDPEVYLAFFEDWSSIHDVTGQLFAVICPKRNAGLLTSGPGPGGLAFAVRDLELRYDELGKRTGGEYPTPQVLSREEAESLAGVPRRATRTLRDGLTNSATALQDFFGIPESCLPCVVVVAWEERQGFAVELSSGVTVYDLMKRMKVYLEPVAGRLRRTNAVLAELQRDRTAVASLRRAESAYRQWSDHRKYLQDQLERVTASWEGSERALACWMAERLDVSTPLNAEEEAQVERLCAALRVGRGAKVAKRLRRGLDKLNDGYPRSHPDVRGYAHVPEAEIMNATVALQEVDALIAAASADLRTIRGELRIGDAVLATAADLGLTPAAEGPLQQWRSFAWPLTVLSRPAHAAPSLRRERG
jgi:hypothetical protein